MWIGERHPIRPAGLRNIGLPPVTCFLEQRFHQGETVDRIDKLLLYLIVMEWVGNFGTARKILRR
jgi:hypothetical protein